MKVKVLRSVVALAIALTISQPASADVGRTVVVPFEFYGIRASAPPSLGEDHVAINVVDSQGNPVYFTVEQDGNPGFAGGCGTLQWGETLVADPGSGQLLFPIHDRSDVHVLPWAGPSPNNVLDPGGTPCPGSSDPYLILPGVTGTVTFTFHNHVL